MSFDLAVDSHNAVANTAVMQINLSSFHTPQNFLPDTLVLYHIIKLNYFYRRHKKEGSHGFYSKLPYYAELLNTGTEHHIIFLAMNC
jgi:hypothetical protein